MDTPKNKVVATGYCCFHPKRGLMINTMASSRAKAWGCFIGVRVTHWDIGRFRGQGFRVYRVKITTKMKI